MAVSKDLNNYEKWNLPLLYPCSLVWCRNGGWFMPEGWSAKWVYVCRCLNKQAHVTKGVCEIKK